MYKETNGFDHRGCDFSNECGETFSLLYDLLVVTDYRWGFTSSAAVITYVGDCKKLVNAFYCNCCFKAYRKRKRNLLNHNITGINWKYVLWRKLSPYVFTDNDLYSIFMFDPMRAVVSVLNIRFVLSSLQSTYAAS